MSTTLNNRKAPDSSHQSMPSILAAIALAVGLFALPIAAGGVFSGEAINLELADADLEAVLGHFSEVSGLAFAIDPQIQAKVSVRLDGIPWDQVLDLILTIEGLGHEVEGETLHVYRKTSACGRQILVSQ